MNMITLLTRGYEQKTLDFIELGSDGVGPGAQRPTKNLLVVWLAGRLDPSPPFT